MPAVVNEDNIQESTHTAVVVCIAVIVIVVVFVVFFFYRSCCFCRCCCRCFCRTVKYGIIEGRKKAEGMRLCMCPCPCHGCQRTIEGSNC